MVQQHYSAVQHAIGHCSQSYVSQVPSNHQPVPILGTLSLVEPRGAQKSDNDKIVVNVNFLSAPWLHQGKHPQKWNRLLNLNTCDTQPAVRVRQAHAVNHMWRKSVLIINLVPIRAMLSFVDPQGAQRASYLADSARCRHSLALRLSSKDIIQKIRTSSSNEIRVIHSLRSVPTSGSRVAFYGL